MKKLIFATTLMICLAAPTFQFAQKVENTAKDARLEAFENHRKEIDKIKNNTQLSQEEKEILIKEKRKAFKQKVGKRKGKKEGKEKGMAKGKKKGKGKGKFLQEERIELKKQAKAIDNNSNLSKEEKEAQKEALRTKLREKNEEARIKRKGQKAEMKKQLDVIDNDSSISNEEKKAKKRALKEEYKNKLDHNDHRLNSPGKKGYGKKGHNKKGKKNRIQKMANDDRDDRVLSKKEIKKANNRLDLQEKKLNKLLKKEKINLDEYNQRMESISKVRSQLSKN